MLLYICVFALYWSSITSWLTLTLCQYFWSDKLLDPLCSSSWCRWRSFLGQLEMSLFPVLACWSHWTVPSQGCAAICLKVRERVGAEWWSEVGLTSSVNCLCRLHHFIRRPSYSVVIVVPHYSAMEFTYDTIYHDISYHIFFCHLVTYFFFILSNFPNFI